MTTTTPAKPETVSRLTAVLAEALLALGRAGDPDRANRLAGRAWSALRAQHPAQARRINGLMHRLTDLPQTIEEQTMQTTDTDPQLDVRTEPPPRRHELIFDSYERLTPGSAFVLVNDHDPKPLYYQFEAEHAGEFSWDYLEQGPVVWRVRIGRPA